MASSKFGVGNRIHLGTSTKNDKRSQDITLTVQALCQRHHGYATVDLLGQSSVSFRLDGVKIHRGLLEDLDSTGLSNWYIESPAILHVMHSTEMARLTKMDPRIWLALGVLLRLTAAGLLLCFVVWS